MTTYVASKSWYHKVFRTVVSEKEYNVLENMLLYFDRDVVLVLFMVLLEKYLDNSPMEDDALLMLMLQAMFEPKEKDLLWEGNDDQEFIDWRLYGDCGIHVLKLENLTIYMLVDMEYPIPFNTTLRMLNVGLNFEVDNCEMVEELINIFGSQTYEG